MAPTAITSSSEDWIELNSRKQFSRCLYPSPVCCLCTVPQPNVMVLSWLTATNNHGNFVFSINRQRFSVCNLQQQPEFVLCVPVRGMENLICQIGKVSGQFVSKFAAPYPPSEQRPMLPAEGKLTPYQRRKLPQEGKPIPNLVPIPVPREPNIPPLFAIEGTCAIIICVLDQLLSTPNLTDSDHYLGVAHITQAFVRESYWDRKKQIFAPSTPGISPFLSFAGSKTFLSQQQPQEQSPTLADNHINDDEENHQGRSHQGDN